MTSTPIPTVGITGGIGSGKSAVAAIIERLGIPVLSADRIAKEISTTDPRVRKRIIALLGPDAYLADGTYNRPWVASKIFQDRGLQKKLEAIVHPAVDAELRKRLTALRKAGARWAGVEAALVFEAKMDAWLDAVILVDADPDIRIARVVRRDGGTADDVRRRMKAQLDPSKTRGRADFVITNDGSPDDLERNTRFVVSLLHHLFTKG